jgi:Holliday junction resolvase-like predicted endonuclease
MIDFEIMQQQISENTRQLQKINELILRKINATETYLTMEEAQEYCRFDAMTIRKYKNEIGYSQRGRKIIFAKSDIDKWLFKYKIQTSK